MVRRKCTAKQLAALKRGREKLKHKRATKATKGFWGDFKKGFKIGTAGATKIFSPILGLASFINPGFGLAKKGLDAYANGVDKVL